MTDTTTDTMRTAADEGRQVASTAAEQAREVMGTAAEQAASVGGQAVEQARGVLDSATGEVRDQLEQRLRDLAGAARGTANELEALCDGRPDDAGRTRDLARQASEHLGRMADRAEEMGVQGVVQEVGDMARRRPVVFLAGAAAAGVLVGRLARAGREARSDEGDGNGNGAVTPTPAAGMPAPAAPLPPPVPSPPPPPAMPGTDPGGSTAGWVGGA
ncbi:MAG TPA: hypothetical protein VEW93_07820 [Acidimicrobiales bacterium]|nr:hypothetical protein [Acidimicrobiales bacterium]